MLEKEIAEFEGRLLNEKKSYERVKFTKLLVVWFFHVFYYSKKANFKQPL